MTLKPQDVHFIFDDDANRLVGYAAAGLGVFRAEARNRATGGEGFGHNARAPRGEFRLGVPRPHHAPPYGFWFTPIEDYADQHAMRDFGREGIGVHGGGSGLKDPFAPQQGWVSTHGCIRIQNAQNAEFVGLVQRAQAAGGVCYFTVIGA